jgi:hypothetical protein
VNSMVKLSPVLSMLINSIDHQAGNCTGMIYSIAEVVHICSFGAAVDLCAEDVGLGRSRKVGIRQFRTSSIL